MHINNKIDIYYREPKRPPPMDRPSKSTASPFRSLLTPATPEATPQKPAYDAEGTPPEIPAEPTGLGALG